MSPAEAREIKAALPALIDRFYGRVRADAVLGPVFNDAIDDWPAHLDRLVDFWSSVMLKSRLYKGDPMGAHLKHAARIDSHMFTRWLGLWTETTNEVLSPSCALQMQETAARIARSLDLALTFRLPPAGQSPGAA